MSELGQHLPEQQDNRPVHARRLEKSGTEVEAKGRHAEGGQQADAAKERYNLERLSIAFRLRGLTLEDVGNYRVHGRLPVVGRHFDTRCSFQSGFEGQ